VIAEVRSRPKKARKPQARTQILWDAISAIADEYERMTIRQLFYQLVSRGEVEKTEPAYKRVVAASGQMRIAGVLPYGKIADGSRQRRRVAQWSGPRILMEQAVAQYRKDYWLHQPEHIEVWCEKDALSGVLMPICEAYGVHYVATRGNPSITLIYESAMDMFRHSQPDTIIYLGDHDASGRGMSDRLEDQFAQHDLDLTVDRVAVNPDQITRYNLPTRWGKQSDSQQAKFAAKYGNASVEVDALPPDVLTGIVSEAITSRIDWGKWDADQHAEAVELVSLSAYTADLTALGIDPTR
jgi:hypothetical protein